MQITKPHPTTRLGRVLAGLILIAAPSLQADVSVNNLFGDHMVLQRNAPLPVWGSADPGEAVTVRIGENSATTVAGEDGSWSVSLAPMQAGGPHMLVIQGTNKLVFEDVLIGEVWVASGQSNMQWNVGNSINGDLDKLLVARNSQIRLIPVKNKGSQEPQDAFPGTWTVAAADTVGGFSAVAYSFAETLHATLGIPVGIIENSWGGSSAEAWVSRQVIAEDPILNSIHTQWLETEASYDFEAEKAAAEVALAEWEIAAASAREAGLPAPNKPRPVQDKMTAQHRPGNLWNARVLPVVPYTIRGAIWYQGEANASRAGQYRTLFPVLIREWRKAWKSDFPFYWVQLADFQKESEFSPDDPWPFLREAQTLTLQSVPHTGQAVIIDLGEGKDIHPRHKEEVGRRLARWALNRDYGYPDLVCRSPEFAAFSQEEDKLVVKFDYTGGGLRPFDTKEVKGFAVQTEAAGWQLVDGTVTSADTVVLALPDASPVTALRYAWANNPVCNLFSEEGLPVTPFRTDFQ
jgi:sialate O-acetylesterase